MSVGDTPYSVTIESELTDDEAYNLARALGIQPPLIAAAAAAAQRCNALSDAAWTVVQLAKPTTPRKDQMRTVVRLLMRLDGPDERRARLLRDAASNARHNPEALRQLLAAREVLLHPKGTRP